MLFGSTAIRRECLASVPRIHQLVGYRRSYSREFSDMTVAPREFKYRWFDHLVDCVGGGVCAAAIATHLSVPYDCSNEGKVRLTLALPPVERLPIVP